MAEHGYGAPSAIPAPDYAAEAFDWGYGDPSALAPFAWDLSLAAEQDAGYGSPLLLLILAPVGGAFVVRDDGGTILKLAASWPGPGPYRVEVIDATGFARVCHGLVPGEATEYPLVFAGAGNAAVRFALPPLPVGTHDLRVTWDAGAQESVLEDGLVVVHRTRHPSVYRQRRGFPSSVYGPAGARTVRDEALLS